MPYDFDEAPDRRGTSSLKWDFGERFVGRDDLLPLWVADMDFRLPEEIQLAIERRVAHGVFGYTLEPESYFEAASGWLERRHAFRVEREWMLASPGVMVSMAAAILAYTEPGERIVVQPPVYPLFAGRIAANGREVVNNPLVLDGSRYVMDFDGLERLLDRRTRMLILSSPHNPVARVWHRDELETLVSLCARNGTVILSDEIHNDIVMPGQRHVPVASLSDEAGAITVTLVSATKSFNLAGLGSALAIARDRKLREALQREQSRMWPGTANAVSVAATEAAWRHGDRWLDELLAYLRGNYELLGSELGRMLEAARLFPLEGTYFAWIDVRGCGLADGEAIRRLRDVGGVWLDEGRKFGTGGQGFQRLNLACPRATIRKAAEGMARALGGKG